MQRALEKLHDQGLAILAINMGEEEDAVLRFSKDYAVQFPVLLDKDSSVSQQWSALGLPTTFLVDREGHITHSAVGAREWDHPGMIEGLRRPFNPSSGGRSY
jgi:peroxiredoxin